MSDDMMDIEQFAASAGLEPRVVELWVTREWIVPAAADRGDSLRPGAAFDALDAARARFIRELQADFGVNDEGIDIVLHLFDQLNGMREAMRELREEFLRGR